MVSTDISSPLRQRSRPAPDSGIRFAVGFPDTLEIVHGRSDLEEIERFRYSIYVAEQHKPLPAADHRASRLPDEDDAEALHFCVRNRDRKLVAYARMHYAEAIPGSAIARMGLGDLVSGSPRVLGFISKLMVDRSLRGRTNAVRLIMSMIQYGCDRFTQAEGAVFHCSSELVPLYTRMGFRPFGTPFLDPYVGLQTPMVAIFRDLAHFEQCGSPISSIAQALPAHDKQLAAFSHYFVVKRAFHCENYPPAPVPATPGPRSARFMPQTACVRPRAGIKLA